MVYRYGCKHDGCNITPGYHAVATLSVVVMAIALVILQHGCTLVGDATASPAVSVGDTAEEQGTQIVQKMFSVTGHTPHWHPHL